MEDLLFKLAITLMMAILLPTLLKLCHTCVRYFRYLVVNHMFFANFILYVCLISLYQTKTEFKSGATLRAGLIIFLREDKERIRSVQGTRCWQ